MTTQRPLILGAVLHGAGAHGSELWRLPDVPTNASIDIDWYTAQAQDAEAAGFDFVFIVDSQYVDAGFPPHHLNRLEPLTLLAAVAARTSRIGLIATVSTTYSEPFDIARRIASLDLISGGRAGWNIVTSQDPDTAGNFSRDEHGDYASRYGRARESVDVVRALWESYEPDAFTTDKRATRFLDPAKQHRIDHRGTHFHVTGPLNIQTSRQVHPVLVQAGASDHGRDLSAAVADIVFNFAIDLPSAVAFNDDVRARTRAAGRNPDDVRFVPGLVVEFDELPHPTGDRDDDLASAYFSLGRAFGGYDFTTHDLDAPFPDVPDVLGGGPNALHKTAALVQRARDEGLTLRQVLAEQSRRPWLATFRGSPVDIADEIIRWQDAGAADGFNLFVHSPHEWQVFREQVVPILRDRGRIAEHDDGATLRERLDLPIPQNRHVAARSLSHAAAGS